MVNYIEQLQEALEDENIVLTYKWLSLTFGISANSAKKVLQEFLDSKTDQEKSGLTTIYCLYGIPYDSHQSLKICLAKKEQKETTEKKFVRVIASHVYSISKSSESLSTQIYNSDSDLISRNLSLLNNYSSISSSAVYCSNPRSLMANGNQEKNIKKAVNEKANTFPNQKQERSPKAATIDKAYTKDIPKVDRNPSIQRKETEKVVESSLNKAKVHNKPGGIALMFQKQSSNPCHTRNEVGSKVDKLREEPPVSCDQLSVNTNIEIGEKVKEPSRQTKLSKPYKSKVSKSRKKKCAASDDEESPIPKKRKRVVFPTDSSDSEAEAEYTEEQEEIIPPPLCSKAEHIFIQSEPTNTKKRTTKWVDKTYMDDDGFIVTKKEVEHVDESDEDKINQEKNLKSVEEVKKEIANDQKNLSPPKPPMKKKQSSIINYFQKK